MHNVVKQWREDATNFNILAFITDRCNYNCWYCYNHNKTKHADLDLNTLKKYVDFVKYKTNRAIDLDLIGGEPTQHPYLLDFCKSMDNVNICIYTNFSRDLEYLKTLAQHNVKFDITFHNDKIDNIYAIDVKSIRGITVMLDKDQFDTGIETFKKLKKNFDDVDLQLVFIGDSIDSYTQQQLDEYHSLIEDDQDCLFSVQLVDGSIMKVSHNQLYELTNQKYMHWQCNAGKDLIYIHNTGNVYRCDGCYNANLKPEFNIYNGMKIIQTGTICPVKNCPFEDNVMKRRVFND